MARSTASYLAVPRPWDAMFKAQLVWFGYALVRLASDPADAQAVPVVLVAWAAFELGAYQARYLLNDLADADLDRMHVAAAVRGRLPPGAAVRRAALVVLAGRLGATACAIAVLPARARALSAAAVGVLAVITLLYEGIRAPMRHGRCQNAPSGIAVTALVGSGYALRMGFGVALAGGSPALVAWAALFAWPLGTMGVVMFWILEAARLRADGDRHVLARKPHLALLGRLVGDDPDHRERPLLRGAAALLAAALAAAASTTAVLLGAALDGGPGVGQLGVLLAVCGLASPLLLAAWPSPWAGAVALAVSAAAPLVLGGGLPMAVLMVLVMVWAAGGRASAPPWPSVGEVGDLTSTATARSACGSPDVRRPA